MYEYFGNFPLVRYDGKSMIDITRRTAILNKVFGDRYSFYPYIVKNGMRAEQVAEKYYGDPDLVWLVYLSNNIVDPYYQWPMSEDMFNEYLTKKYGSVENAIEKILFYRINWYEDTDIIDVDTYNALPAVRKKYWTPDFDQYNTPSRYKRAPLDYTVVAQESDGSLGELPISDLEAIYWSPVTAYDYENELNINKSAIRLLDNRLSVAAISNLRDLLNDE